MQDKGSFQKYKTNCLDEPISPEISIHQVKHQGAPKLNHQSSSHSFHKKSIRNLHSNPINSSINPPATNFEISRKSSQKNRVYHQVTLRNEFKTQVPNNNNRKPLKTFEQTETFINKLKHERNNST